MIVGGIMSAQNGIISKKRELGTIGITLTLAFLTITILGLCGVDRSSTVIRQLLIWLGIPIAYFVLVWIVKKLIKK